MPEATWCFPKVVCFGRGVAGIKILAGALLSSLNVITFRLGAVKNPDILL